MGSVLLSALIFSGFAALAFWIWHETGAYVRVSEQEPPPPPPLKLQAAGQGNADLQALVDEAVDRRTTRGRQTTRWISILIPAVGGILLAAAGGLLNYNTTNATTQAQLGTIQKHQEKQDDNIAANTQAMRDLIERLPKDF